MKKKIENTIRKVDKLGRVVIPHSIRKAQQIVEGIPLEIFIDGNKIIYRKYKKSCSFCSNTDNLINFKEKTVCPSCIKNLGKL